MLIENDEFDWLGDVKPVGQQLQQKETLEPDEFDWLNNLVPISEMKEPEPKPSLFEQIKAFGKKAFPAVKKAIPAILSSVLLNTRYKAVVASTVPWLEAR